MAPAPADAKLSFFEALYAEREADAHEIAGGISLGAAVASKDKQAMRKRRITHVLICHPSIKEEHPQKFVYGRVPLLDDPCANLLELLPSALAFLGEARAAKGHVFVCCAKGISRSSSVVMSMLMFEQGLPFDEAFRICEKRRPIVYPNIGFQQQLRHLEKLLQEIDRAAPPAERVAQLRKLVPRGALEGPKAPLQVRERLSDSVTSVLDEVEALADKVCRQPQLLQQRELWKRHGLYFENLHKYKALPSDEKLVDRALEASNTLKSLPKIFSDTLKGVQLALAVAKELDAWAKFAGPLLRNPLLAAQRTAATAAAQAASARACEAEEKDEEDPMKDFLRSAVGMGEKSGKKDKKAKKQAKAEKKAAKAAKKAKKAADKIEKAARKAELLAGATTRQAELAAQRADEAAREIERLEAEEAEAARRQARIRRRAKESASAGAGGSDSSSSSSSSDKRRRRE